MAGNTIGTVFKVTTFGESHGLSIGSVIDGIPAGVAIDIKKIQRALDRRRPGVHNGQANPAVTSRKEDDRVEIISGVFNGMSEGTPIALLIKNTSQRTEDYINLAHTFRPGHADSTYFAKYGVRDYRGGGRASGRETACRVAAGAVAQMLLDCYGISIKAYTERAAGVSVSNIDFSQIEMNGLRAPDNEAAKVMSERIALLRAKGDSAGGIVSCLIKCRAGLGEPVFDKLDAEIAKAMLSIGAVKGIEFGSGFAASDMTGSQCNDAMKAKGSAFEFSSNNSGGILGGISNGSDIFFRLAVKPVPSISLEQQTVLERTDESGNTVYEDTELSVQGRHDVCLCPRIVPVVEAMAAIVLADMLLRSRSSRL